LRRRAAAGIILRSTLRTLNASLRARIQVVPIEGLQSTKLFVTAAVSPTLTPARRATAERWLRRAGTAARFRSMGLEAPYREP
jgi:hypothetical protein